MKERLRNRAGVALVIGFFLTAGFGFSEEPSVEVNPGSPWGLDFYCQGGVVVDGVGYFAANDVSRREGVERTGGFPCVVAFDAQTFRKIRSYDFDFTYDSSPFVTQKKDGTWLVIAHEYKKARTVARNRDTGEVEWISEANQPGAYFFGYSYYERPDGSKLLLMACRNGLHALSSETGEDLWWVQRRGTGGVTPCVDQAGGRVYYQCDGKVLKIRATDGTVLKEVRVNAPNRCISWNTVLVDDEHGHYVATRWYGKPEWDSAIRVYDRDLKLLWERTGLPTGKKDTLTYSEGKLVSGSGNGWSTKYSGDDWKYIAAYRVADGKIAWKCDLSRYDYIDILNLVYANGCLYGESGGKTPPTAKCFRIRAATGALEEVYDYGRGITSCASHIIAGGKMFSGDLWQDRVAVTHLAEGAQDEWPGPFGDPQTNQMAAVGKPGARLERMQEIGPYGPATNEGRANLLLGAEVAARSRIRGAQSDVYRMIDNNPETFWSTGPGDLALHPADVDLGFDEPRTADTLVIETRTLKGRLRLKDFDLYAGLNGAWDGAHPLAEVRDNTDEVVGVRFPAIRVDRLRLRILGSHRPDNGFANVGELAVYAAAEGPQRKVERSPLPPTFGDCHDPDLLKRYVASLAAEAKNSRPAQSRLRALKKRLQLIEESRPYEATLDRISAETERFRTLGAPEWALAQRDCMARLRTWAYYWIDRQQPDGQFGGGYEDDVELICGWPVLVLAQDDTKVRRSLDLLAENVWKSRPFLERFGYGRYTDVEHAAENISYSQPMMLVLDPTNPKWPERCRRTVSTLGEHFLSRNAKGRLQFRSDHFGFDPRTLEPRTGQGDRPFDIPESAKALKPALYVVWAGGEAQARDILLDYGRTWVEAALEGEGASRIEGLLPRRIQWPGGQATGTQDRLAPMRATLFHLIGCYHVSGDPRFLDPIRAFLEKSLFEWSVNGIPSAGTLDAVREEDFSLFLEQLSLIASLYRQATGDRRFDDAIVRWTGRVRDSLVDGVKSYVLLNRKSETLWHVDRPLSVGAYQESRSTVGSQLYLGWQVTGDDGYLARLGWNVSSCLNDKWGALTYWFYDKSERRVTSNDHLAHQLQYSEAALCQMYTGGPGPVEAIWPQLAVTWKDVGENFCALVRRDDSRGLRAELYCFDEKPRSITANLWELAPGTYEAVVAPASRRDGQKTSSMRRHTFEVRGSVDRPGPTPIRFALPARSLTVLEVAEHRGE